MRCPKCKLTVADKRDICPGCHFDLRPEKEKLGLPVVAPSASYEKLLEAAKSSAKPVKKKSPSKKKKRTKKKPAPQKKSGFFELVRSFFGTKKSVKKISLPETTRAVEAIPTPEMFAEESISQLYSSPIEPPRENPLENLEALQLSEPSPESLAIDELAFDSLFDEDSELEELGPPPEIPREVEEEALLLKKLQTSIDENLDEVADALRQLKSESNNFSPVVTPEVVEFDSEDEALFDEQLNAMLGDETLEIEAVKQVKAEPSKQMQVEDDFEISFEFEVEGEAPAVQSMAAHSGAALAVHEFEDPPQEVLSSLESALSSLEEELEVRSIAESEDFGESSDFEDTELQAELALLEAKTSSRPSLPEAPRFKESLKGDPQELAKLLLAHLSTIYGVDSQQFFESSAEEEFEEEDSAEFEEDSILLEEPLLDLSPELEDLTAELDSELQAFEGFSVHTGEGAEEEEETDSILSFTEEPILGSEQDLDSEEIEWLQHAIEIPDLGELEVVEERVEAGFTPVIEASPTKERQPVEELWTAAEAELCEGEASEQSIEFSEIFNDSSRDKNLLLFDTAYEALLDSAVEDTFATKIEISVNREIENKHVEEIFETYGEAAYEAQVALDARMAAGIRSLEEELPWIKPEGAPLWKRALSSLTDLGLITAISLAIGWFVVMSSEERNFISSEGAWAFNLFLFKYGWTVVASSLFLSLLQGVLVWGRGSSVGQGLFGTEVYEIDGFTPGLGRSLIRAAAHLTELLTFGFIIGIFGSKRTLADRLSDTGVTIS